MLFKLRAFLNVPHSPKVFEPYQKTLFAHVRKSFSAPILFHSCRGVDTQAVLNGKTPSEVADALRRNVEILAPGGGFVFCQVHNIQPDVPTENVIAVFDALDEYGVY